MHSLSFVMLGEVYWFFEVMNYFTSFAFLIFVSAGSMSVAAPGSIDELNARDAQATITQIDNSSALHATKKQRLNLLFEQISRAEDPDEATSEVSGKPGLGLATKKLIS